MGPEARAHAWDPQGAMRQSHAWWAPTAWQSVWLKVSPHAWPEKAQLARQGAWADLVSSPPSLPWGVCFSVGQVLGCMASGDLIPVLSSLWSSERCLGLSSSRDHLGLQLLGLRKGTICS